MDHGRLSMPVGEVMFTQRSIRRFTPDPIPMEDLRLIIEAAMRAPNGGNSQVARFLVDELGLFDLLRGRRWFRLRRGQQRLGEHAACALAEAVSLCMGSGLPAVRARANALRFLKLTGVSIRHGYRDNEVQNI